MMNTNTDGPTVTGWMDSSGLSHILRTFKIAVHPSKIVLALGAIFLTVLWGMLLDWVWTATDNGISPGAISSYVGGVDAASEADGEEGIFAVFRDYQLGCVRDAVESVRYGRIIGSVRAGEPIIISTSPGANPAVRGAFTDLVLMGRGMVWMIRTHFLYAVLFLVGGILIWGFLGGAVCRMAAVQFTRDESISIKDALQFAWGKLFGGFFMAPIVPLLICLFIGLMLVIGGLFLRIPWFGEIVGGLLFFLALIGGLLIALVLLGSVAGGSLFWPTVAVEGSDSFDAISRSFSYVYGRPLRTLWYAFLLLVYGSFSFLFVKFLVWLALASTYLFVGFGSGDKLNNMWVSPTFETLYEISTGAREGGRVHFTVAALIGLWMLPVVGAVWAFLASFYLTGSTIAYYLLRRDVDGTDLGDIYIEEQEPQPLAVQPESAPLAAPETTETPAPAAETEKPPVEEETPPEPTTEPDESDEPEAADQPSAEAQTPGDEESGKATSDENDKDDKDD